MPLSAASFAAVDPNDEHRDDLELGSGSMWTLRIGSAIFLVVLAYFLIDAIVG